MVFLPLILITRGRTDAAARIPFLHLMRAAPQRRWHDPILYPLALKRTREGGLPKGADLCPLCRKRQGGCVLDEAGPAFQLDAGHAVPISFRPAFRNGQFLMVARSKLAKASALAPIVLYTLIVAVAAGYIMFSEIPDLNGHGSDLPSLLQVSATNNYRERQLARQGAAMLSPPRHNPKGVFQ